MTINRTKVADAEVFKEATRLHGVLRRILDLQEKITEAGTQNARQTIHQAIQVGTHLVVNRVRNHAVQVLAKTADVRCDTHLVIVQDDGHVLLGGANVIDRLVSHTARHGAISNDSDHVVVAVEMVAGNGKAKSRRNRRRGVARPEAVVNAFVPLEEAGNASLLAQGIESVIAAGQQLVHVRLVPHVPHDLIVGCVEHVVQRKSQFNNAKARCQVTTVLCHLTNDGLADLRGEVVQFLDRTVLQVLRRLYVFQFHLFHSRDDVCRYRTEDGGITLEAVQCLDGFLVEFPSAFPRLFQSNDGRVSCLALFDVRPGILAKLFGRRDNVQNVIHNLEGKPDGAAIAADDFHITLACIGKHSTHEKSGFDEGSRLVVVNVIDNFEIDSLAFAFDVGHFATDHAVSAEQVREDFDSLCVTGLAHHLEGVDAESVARHHGSGFAKLLVARELSTAVVVVIDTRKVIVDKAERVEHFESARCKPNLVSLAAKHVERGLGKPRTQALAACEHGIAHSLVQTARTVLYWGEMFIKLRLGILCDTGEIFLSNFCF